MYKSFKINNLQIFKFCLSGVIASYINYLVYVKTQDNDPIDLVAVHRNTGEVLKLDVKTVSYRKTCRRKGDRINRVVNKHQKKIGVTLLYVYPDGRCDFHGKN